MSDYVVLVMKKEKFDAITKLFEELEKDDSDLSDFLTDSNPEDLFELYESLWGSLKRVTLDHLDIVKEELEKVGYKVFEK